MKRRPVNFKAAKKAFRKRASKTNSKNLIRAGSPRGGFVL